MQDQYVGDIGDYLKLSILRGLTPGRRLGVAWWLYPDGHNADGKHIHYLSQPERWRRFDPALFDALQAIIAAGTRRVSALEAAGLLPGAVYASAPIPVPPHFAERRRWREAWFAEVSATVEGCDLVFLDPDNGLETKGFKPGASKAGKSVSLAELDALRAPGRALLVYHHQTRMAGGHLFELSHWGARLRAQGFARVDALRASPYSPRAFFLLDGSEDLRQRAQALVAHWGPKQLTWHPGLGEQPAASV